MPQLTDAIARACSVKKVFLEISQNSKENTCQIPFFNKVAGLRPATLLKKRPWHRCFPVNLAKFLRTPFPTEHPRWLLLNWSTSNSRLRPCIMFLVIPYFWKILISATVCCWSSTGIGFLLPQIFAFLWQSGSWFLESSILLNSCTQQIPFKRYVISFVGEDAWISSHFINKLLKERI